MHSNSTPPQDIVRRWTMASPGLRPTISPALIGTIGLIAFIAAFLWPPILLIVSILLALIAPTLFFENDSSEGRRRLYKLFLKHGDLPEAMKCSDVDLEEDYWTNSRGMLLATSIMRPKEGTPIKAVVCFCHGFLGSSSYLIRCEYQRMVRAGIAVVTIDYEGHGLSDGQQGLIPNWERLCNDTLEYFEEALTQQFSSTPRFLCGESMGGAACFTIYNKKPQLWKGVVFHSPLCKIKEEMLPSPLVVKIFMAIVGEKGTNAFSTLPIAPSKKSLLDDVFKSEEKRILAKDTPLYYGDRKPRLASARELLRVSGMVSSNLKDFNAPFLVQHGRDDVVTDPDLSQALYDEASSADKAIKLYDGMWHSINVGESDENLDIVFRDAIEWILKRS